MILRGPRRIVCLTEETTETLYRIGEQDRIVGISGFTVRPPQARKEKPKVSAFTSAKIERILALKPDLVLGFSDLQADIAADLIRAGVAVHIFNQRSVAEIFEFIQLLGTMVHAGERTRRLIDELQAGIERVSERAARLSWQPRVYFEEWDEPMISAIRWVSELIGIAGGEDCFAKLAAEPSAQRRIIADGNAVIARAPDLIVGSWCGKKFKPERVAARAGWDAIPAVRNGRLREIKSPDILQPGPAALSDGLSQLHEHIAACAMSAAP
jgi:iron complex transport system substrate-binding protein